MVVADRRRVAVGVEQDVRRAEVPQLVEVGADLVGAPLAGEAVGVRPALGGGVQHDPRGERGHGPAGLVRGTPQRRRSAASPRARAPLPSRLGDRRHAPARQADVPRVETPAAAGADDPDADRT